MFQRFKRGGQLAKAVFQGGVFVEDVLRREHDIPEIYRSDLIRGGFSEVRDEGISCRVDELRESPDTGEKRNSSRRGSPVAERGGVDPIIRKHKPYILESFYYADETTEKLIPYFGDFLLDSGAYTFMQNSKSHVDWNEYIERYADFVNRNKVKKYFELDIDSVVGYEAVKKYRKRLESLTGVQCIPVWHSSRGTKEFVKMCEEYPYVAIGGLVGTGKSEYARKYWKFFPWFIRTAHEHGSKIHALGFTSLDGIKKYHFDSVDSTAWTTGNRFGFIWKFTGDGVAKIEVPKGKRLGDSRQVALINYTEWIKFQRYADKYL